MKLVFTASNTWVGRAIRWFTNSPTSHVMIGFNCPMLRADVTVDADIRGVALMPAYKTRNNVVAEFSCPEHVRQVLPSVTRYLGERYDFAGLVWAVWPAVLWRWLRVKVKHPLRHTKEVKCSELVSTLFKEAKLPGTAEWDPEMVSPGDLLKYCSLSDQFIVVRPVG